MWAENTLKGENWLFKHSKWKCSLFSGACLFWILYQVLPLTNNLANFSRGHCFCKFFLWKIDISNPGRGEFIPAPCSPRTAFPAATPFAHHLPRCCLCRLPSKETFLFLDSQRTLVFLCEFTDHQAYLSKSKPSCSEGVWSQVTCSFKTPVGNTSLAPQAQCDSKIHGRLQGSWGNLETL